MPNIFNLDKSLFSHPLIHMELEMNELNGNEKYFYLDESLPVNPYSPKTIEKGDIMLLVHLVLLFSMKISIHHIHI